jgi:hypothetical protein
MVAKRAIMETEARKLARTGTHGGWETIQMALVAQGFEEAPKVFANLWARSELDRLCERARLTARTRSGATGNTRQR